MRGTEYKIFTDQSPKPLPKGKYRKEGVDFGKISNYTFFSNRIDIIRKKNYYVFLPVRLQFFCPTSNYSSILFW